MIATEPSYKTRTAQSRRSTMVRLLLLTLFLCTFLGGARAQYETHWPGFNDQNFADQAALVAAIVIDGEIITAEHPNWDALEIAFFVGDECRGNSNYLYNGYVEEYGDPFPIINGAPVYYNETGGVVTVKMYDHLNDIEYDECTVTFMGEPFNIIEGDDNMQGWFDPENPIMLNFTTPAIEDLLLLDVGDLNSEPINDAYGKRVNVVTLADRTLYKDGDWNTICLPFDVDKGNSPLADAEVMMLEEAVMDGTHVTLTFVEVDGWLDAGMPYIIRWEEPDEPIVSPVFNGVTITSTEGQTIEKAEGNVKFIGYYDAFNITADDDDIYYLTSGSTFKHTGVGRTLHACRAYFKFSDEAAARQFILNFGENGGTTTGIVEVEDGTSMTTDSTYDLLGRKAPNGQLRKGLYIKDGHKVVIK